MILLLVVTLGFLSNLSVRILERPSTPPLEYANCRWPRLRPEAEIFSAIVLDIFF